MSPVEDMFRQLPRCINIKLNVTQLHYEKYILISFKTEKNYDRTKD